MFKCINPDSINVEILKYFLQNRLNTYWQSINCSLYRIVQNMSNITNTN